LLRPTFSRKVDWKYLRETNDTIENAGRGINISVQISLRGVANPLQINKIESILLKTCR
jgi:hypothetical protein